MNKIYSPYQSVLKICDSIVTSSGVTIPCITGQTGLVDVISQNGYRYKAGFWDEILNNPLIQEKIQKRKCLGTIEHPEDDSEYLSTSYEQASHVVMKAWVQNHQPFATFGLLNNPKGNAIKALIDVGCNPGVSTRGLGNFESDSISSFVSSENYAFITWDIVKDPNFSELDMRPISDSIKSTHIFKELCEMHQLKDSSDKSYNKDTLSKSMDRAIEALLDFKKNLQFLD